MRTVSMLVNPYSAEDLADAVAQALTMSRAERVRRWQALMAGVREQDVRWWLRNFVAALEGEEAPQEIVS